VLDDDDDDDDDETFSPLIFYFECGAFKTKRLSLSLAGKKN